MKYLLNIEVVVDGVSLDRALKLAHRYEQTILENLDVVDVSSEVMEAGPDEEEDDE